MGLAVLISEGIGWLLFLFILLPLILACWFMVATVMAMFLGPLGYFAGFVMMIYFWRHF